MISSEQLKNKRKRNEETHYFKLLPLMESNLMAQILHQSYKMPVPAPIHTASGKLGLAPLFSALANKSVSKVS